MPSELLAEANSQQIKAITHGEGPSLVVAGAGTGKTSVITKRIAYLILEKEVAPEQIVALTFTDKAAGEMQARLDELLPYGVFGVTTSTFHAFCNELIRRHAYRIGINPEARLITEADQVAILREHIGRLPLQHYRPGYHPMSLLGQLAKYIEQAKEARITPEQLIAHAETLHQNAFDEAEAATAAEYLELAKIYQEALKLYQELDVLTYADLLAHTCNILKESKVALAEEQARCQYLLIDEYQDTNSIQAEIAYLLAGKNGNIMVVGDDDQAIYRFRGANVTNILDFQKQYPEAEIIVLTENYRSTQPILDAAYRLIQHNNPHRLEAVLNINKKLTANQKGEAAPEYLRFTTGTHEAECVAERIQKLIESGTAPEAIAVIGRSHNQLDPFHQELEALNIPVTRSKEGNFFEEPSVVQALSYLRFLSHPHNSENLFQLLTGEPFQISGTELVQFNVLARKRHLSLWDSLRAPDADHKDGLTQAISYLDGALQTHSADKPSQALRSHIHDSKWNARLIEAAEERAAIHLNALHRQATTFELLHRPTTIAAFVEHCDRLMTSGEDVQVQSELSNPSGGVNLLTAHASKGLEFPIVFVVNLVMRRFPMTGGASGFQLPSSLVTPLTDNVEHEEERRLAYVAVTRAKEQLFLTSAERYGTNKTPSKPSPFITEALALKEAPAPADQPLRGSLMSTPQVRKAAARLELPTSMSASAIETFADNPALFYEQCVLQIIPEDMTAINFGNAIHNTLRDIFNARREEVTLDLETTFQRYWIGDGYVTPMERDTEYATGIEMLKKHLGTLPADFIPFATEESLTLVLPDGFRIGGKADRIDRIGNKLRIIDYKTGRHTEKPGENLPLAVYALALEQQKKPVQDVTLLYLRSEKEVSLTLTPAFLQERLEFLQTTVARLREAYATHTFPNTGTRFVR